MEMALVLLTSHIWRRRLNFFGTCFEIVKFSRLILIKYMIFGPVHWDNYQTTDNIIINIP
jgi:hypothetical protein